MDALSQILHSVKLEGAVFYNAEFTAPWGFRAPRSCEVAAFLRKEPKHIIIYHLSPKDGLEAKSSTAPIGSTWCLGTSWYFPTAIRTSFPTAPRHASSITADI
jgi:hypothetical protein